MPQPTRDLIPKIIHTCWFGGGAKSAKMLHFERARKEILADYRHLEWNESNIDLARFPFIERCYRQRNFAHVSDMVRVLKLFECGGIYLDTDVQILRSFDPLLSNEMFMGYMWDCNLGTAVIGARPEHPIIKNLLDIYLERPGDISTSIPNNDMVTENFIANVEGFRLDGREWQGKNVRIFDKTTFEHPSFLWRENYTVHHFSASWKGEGRGKAAVKDMIGKAPLGLYLYRKYVCRKSIRLSPFRSAFEKARREERQARPPQDAGGRPSR